MSDKTSLSNVPTGNYTKRYQHMRCPKCGYISFDHLEKCRKCNKDITATSTSLFGSTYNLQAPNYLQVPHRQGEDPAEQEELLEEEFEAADDREEYVDEDLDILIDDGADEEGEIRFADDEETGSGLTEDDEQEEDGEIEIDFSQFESADEPEVNLFEEDEDEEEARPAPPIEIPNELSDISDLAPPANEIEMEDKPAEKSTDSGLSDLELEDLYIDLGLEGVKEEQTKKPGEPEEELLSLDDIDFSEALSESRSESSKKSGGMDEDLDFDLDLGGLSIDKED